jgi:multidrug efflux pump subunit AcrA (membrane-fusion protein)
VVVSGDLKESEGMPMSRGETLFEIAPLGQMVVEIAVPEDDVTHVREGMRVNFYVHALPNRVMNGNITRLHPRAELRNHDNAFIAEVHVRDPEILLRPGMRGRAKILSDRHPLGWNLFHKAYYAMRHSLGW